MAEKNKDNYYKHLMRTMILIVIIVSYTPLLMISFVTAYKFHTAYRAKVLAHLSELVEKHRQNIDGFLTEKMADIKVAANTYPFERLLNEDFLRELLINLQKEHEGVFSDIGLVNQNGLQVAYAGPFRLGRADYAGAKWFTEAMRTEVYISDVFLGLRQLPHFIVAVRIHRDGHDWILRSTIDFISFNRLVENVRIDETGRAFIVNRKGEFQTTPTQGIREEILDLLASYERVPVPKDKSTFDRALMDWRLETVTKTPSNQRVFFHKDRRTGINYINVTTRMKNGDWILFYRQDEADAFRNLYQARNLSILVLILGGVVIFFTALILSRRMVNRIMRADREKEMMNEQVIEAGKLASLGEMAAGIAHEINNPVAIMVEEAGWIEDLLEDTKLPEGESAIEIPRALQQIKTQGKRCKQITHKLLSFARKTDPEIRQVRINDLIEEVIGLSEQRARYAGVTIVRKLTPELPAIPASPTEVQQVLLNLINNAIDAMEHEGGTLEITTRQDNGRIVLDVSDSGQGIPQAVLQRVFDPFFTTKPQGKGTGLGLSICYGIVKKMGGEISVNSAVGVGTCFHVKLPKVSEEGSTGMQGESKADTESATAGTDA